MKIILSHYSNCHHFCTIQQIQFKHCYREANHCADMLAKVGLDQSSRLVHFDCPLEIIRTILDEDCNGIFVDRICTDLDVVS